MFRYVFKAVLLVEIGIRGDKGTSNGFRTDKKLITQKSRKKLGVPNLRPKNADKRGPRITEARIIEV